MFFIALGLKLSEVIVNSLEGQFILCDFAIGSFFIVALHVWSPNLTRIGKRRIHAIPLHESEYFTAMEIQSAILGVKKA